VPSPSPLPLYPPSLLATFPNTPTHLLLSTHPPPNKKMTIHSLYIFSRACRCIYYQNWTLHTSSHSDPLASPTNQSTQQTTTTTTTTTKETESKSEDTLHWTEQAKLVYGVVLSLKNMGKKLATRNGYGKYRSSGGRSVLKQGQ